MKDLEKIIRSKFQFDRLDEAMGAYSEFEAMAKEVWNAAIEMAAEEAFKSTNANVVNKSITKLKFDI